VLIKQLAALQRKVTPSGHEAIEHPRGGHDDSAAAVAHAVSVAYRAPTRAPLVFW
jgi:hypothetical protein